MVRVEGFEPPTFWFVAKRSIQLGYTRIQSYKLIVRTEKFLSTKFSSRPKNPAISEFFTKKMLLLAANILNNLGRRFGDLCYTGML